jgi:hypothetical protein
MSLHTPRTDHVYMYVALYDQKYIISKLFMVIYNEFRIRDEVFRDGLRIYHILFGRFLWIGILTFLRVAMLWNGACRVNSVMDNLADFEISFVIRKELFPMLKTLGDVQGTNGQMNSVRGLSH